ncbi:hypothetical protein BABINDRAFT_123465 [Babjeviella inositovora NRRL Y-12698]|uniref:Uncharacterized protein n=1 Tax=Babjeviella inositovora NRRL Y-12698 TaxID=984486 RepID=A0A1E3QUL9_9ASCO|nr:uncharacterized protein BABINDRAFT_123465 [Babjeviella inositovora NRRL Y-12698]ODQ81360.1 hypothetical protein BABINDRAFT_123465 [Babjeviella inositovora NRRL Y-12698]
MHVRHSPHTYAVVRNTVKGLAAYLPLRLNIKQTQIPHYQVCIPFSPPTMNPLSIISFTSVLALVANAYTYDEEATAAQMATGYANLIINSTLSGYIGPKYDPQPYLLSQEELYLLESTATSVYYKINGKQQRWLMLPEGLVLRYNPKFVEWEAPPKFYGFDSSSDEKSEVKEAYPVHSEREKLLLAYLEESQLSQEEVVSLFNKPEDRQRHEDDLKWYRLRMEEMGGQPETPLWYSFDDFGYLDSMKPSSYLYRRSAWMEVKDFLRYQGWVVILFVACMGVVFCGTYYHVSRKIHQNFGSVKI